jgi:uncharacterized coiled-coil protein SlyX
MITVNTPETTHFPLQNLSERVADLYDVFGRLYTCIDQKINAIVMSDVNRIEDLTEQHSTLHTEFKKMEKAFIESIQKSIPSGEDIAAPLSLRALKQIYPQYATWIDEWQDMLFRRMMQVQRHHDHLGQLLEFARDQNAAIMQSYYQVQTRKNVHYTATGEQSRVPSGVAVNHSI